MAYLKVNFSQGVLASTCAQSAATLTVTSGHTLPTAAGTFPLVIWDSATYPNPADDPNVEIVLGEYSGTPNIYDITRAQESTADVGHASGHKVGLHFTAAVANEFQIHGDVLDDLNTLGANSADSEMLVGTGAGALAWESGATLRTSIGMGIGDSPQFGGLTSTGLITTDELTVSTKFNTPYQQTVTVAKSGGDFTTIQGAIDSISDAADDNRYCILIYPGDYAETIVGESYVELMGLAAREAVNITGATGPLYTFPDNEGHIFNLKFSLSPTTAAQTIIDIPATVNARQIIQNCLFISTTASDVATSIFDINGGEAEFVNNKIIFTNTNTSVGSIRTQKVWDIDGDAIVDLFRNIIDVDISDINDRVIIFDDASTTGGEIHINETICTVTSNNAGAYSGIVRFINYVGETATLYCAHNSVNLSSLEAGGTGTGEFIRTNSVGSAEVKSTSNQVLITGFNTNQSVNVAAGDTVISHMDDIDADDGSTGAGTFTYASSLSDGSFTVTDTITTPNLTVTGNSVLGLNSAVFQPTTDSTTFFQVLDADGGDPVLNVDTDNEVVGIGSTDSDFSLTVDSLTNRIPLNFIRRSTNTGSVGVAFRGIHVTSSDMADGFGTGMRFIIQDNADVENTIGFLNFYRDTADNKGACAIKTGTNGALNALTLNSLGYMGLNETDPETMIELTRIVPYITLHNNTHEDTDGGRESRIIFKGEQSGGEETTLGQIEVCHDGAVDNQFGRFVVSTNTGAGLSEGLRVDSNADVDVLNNFTAGTIQADDGFTGTGAYTNFTIVGGIITAAS